MQSGVPKDPVQPVVVPDSFGLDALKAPKPANPNDVLELIQDEHRPIELPEPPLLPPGVAIGLGIALLLAVAWLIRWRIRAFRSPERRARKRISRIDTASAEPRDLYRQLHAVMVEYFGARAAIPASKQTSAEILSSLRATGFAEPAGLREFLAASDEARFSAGPWIESTPGQTAVAQCRGIVAALGRKRRAKV
jgi:hypothetical protein